MEFDVSRIGWKIHLSVNESADDPVTARIIQYCNSSNLKFKIGGASDEGKNMTIYLGSRKKLENTALELEMLQINGRNIQIPTISGDAALHDMPVGKTGSIYARFQIYVPVLSEDGFDRTLLDAYDRGGYGECGIPILKKHKLVTQAWNSDIDPEWKPLMQHAKICSYEFLKTHFGEYFTNTQQDEIPEWAEEFISTNKMSEDDFLIEAQRLKSKPKSNYANKEPINGTNTFAERRLKETSLPVRRL